MDKKEAISFLEKFQPLPPDNELTQEILERYDTVREYFLDAPDSECIPLFLNSFGEGDGFGVYALVDEVITQFSPHEVLPHLMKALSSKHRSVVYWNAQIAAYYPNPELINPLYALLKRDDFDIKWAAITALAQIKQERERVTNILLKAHGRERNEELREFIKEMIEEYKKVA